MFILAGALTISLLVVFILISLFLILVVLVQKPKGGGLSGAFGGASGSMQTAFGGSKVGDVLTWITVVCFAIFLLVSMCLIWSANADRADAQPAKQQQPVEK